jgi:DNA primase
VIGIADRIAEKHLRLLKFKSDFISAACPFHKGGTERHPSFWINRSKGEWGCFSCSEHGSNLKQLLRKLGVPSGPLEAEIDQAIEESKDTKQLEERKRKLDQRKSFKGASILPEGLLGVFDLAPKSLLDAGFDKQLLRKHDIGFDKKRMRITFPIRDVFGNLIGISGRTVIDEYPKYKVYEGTRILEGKTYLGELSEYFPNYCSTGIRDHLWRGHFVYDDLLHERTSQLIVVEGYKAALWLVKHGWLNTVAIMGSRMSYNQERLIRRMGTETWVLLDNNKPGRDGSYTITRKLACSSTPIYECTYPEHCDEATQPDNLTELEIEDVLSTAKRVGGIYRYGHHKKYTADGQPQYASDEQRNQAGAVQNFR